MNLSLSLSPFLHISLIFLIHSSVYPLSLFLLLCSLTPSFQLFQSLSLLFLSPLSYLLPYLFFSPTLSYSLLPLSYSLLPLSFPISVTPFPFFFPRLSFPPLFLFNFSLSLYFIGLNSPRSRERYKTTLLQRLPPTQNV
uniref:Uncharacterized protein n=1 Tax=Cacopsylla melanoneura TaxID=428564 RepID=A0A8D8YK88_9HEMI